MTAENNLYPQTEKLICIRATAPFLCEADDETYVSLMSAENDIPDNVYQWQGIEEYSLQDTQSLVEAEHDCVTALVTDVKKALQIGICEASLKNTLGGDVARWDMDALLERGLILMNSKEGE